MCSIILSYWGDELNKLLQLPFKSHSYCLCIYTCNYVCLLIDQMYMFKPNHIICQLFFSIPGIPSQRSSQLDHSINFDEYVDIDPSATIEQPNSLQSDCLAVDLQPTSHNPAYDGLLDAMGEYAEPEFLQEKNEPATKAIDKTIHKVKNEDANLNSKTRKLSLQELKSDEPVVKQTKKRNKSLPALVDNDGVTMRADSTKIKQSNESNADAEPKNSVKKNGLNLTKVDEQNEKVSSLRSVLLEVDAYENIEIVNKQSRLRTGVVSMKEQSVNSESKQVPVRRAFSEQTRAPVPQPRANVLKKRKTFDPYDYPPGVPIPKALLEEDEESVDSEYIPHDPLAGQTNASKRKTFDPYDYPPGVPISKALLENGEQTRDCNNDKDNTFIESSGVYIAYDPDNNEETTELDENVGGEYINCGDVVFEENKYNSIQESTNNTTTRYEQNKAASLVEAHAPPKPCSGPYYVNEHVNIFETESDQSDISNDKDAKSDRNISIMIAQENLNTKSSESNTLSDDGNTLKNYDKVLASENGLPKKITDKTVVTMPGSGATVSESGGNTPSSISIDTQQYQSDNGGIYQNLNPPKPPRLHQSLEKLDNSNAAHIDVNRTETDSSLVEGKLGNETGENLDYEDVLVVNKRKESDKDLDHGYVNVKRFS